MVEIKIINETLAGALSEMAGAAVLAGAAPGTPVPPAFAAIQTPVVTAPPVEPASLTYAAPTVTAPVMSNPVPTVPAPSFTLDQLGKAGADLIGNNPAKMDELLALLQQFGVPAINNLVPEQLGAFATALRGLGAKI